MPVRSRNNSIDYKANTKNRSRSYSIEYKLSNRSRNTSEDDGARYSSDRSSRSFSIGSWDSIYIQDDWEMNDISNSNSNSNYIHSNNVSTTSRNSFNDGRTLLFECKFTNVETIQVDNKSRVRRKRDVYVNEIKASPKPSSFISYITQHMKK